MRSWGRGRGGKTVCQANPGRTDTQGEASQTDKKEIQIRNANMFNQKHKQKEMGNMFNRLILHRVALTEKASKRNKCIFWLKVITTTKKHWLKFFKFLRKKRTLLD